MFRAVTRRCQARSERSRQGPDSESSSRDAPENTEAVRTFSEVYSATAHRPSRGRVPDRVTCRNRRKTQSQTADRVRDGSSASNAVQAHTIEQSRAARRSNCGTSTGDWWYAEGGREVGALAHPPTDGLPRTCHSSWITSTGSEEATS